MNGLKTICLSMENLDGLSNTIEYMKWSIIFKRG